MAPTFDPSRLAVLQEVHRNLARLRQQPDGEARREVLNGSLRWAVGIGLLLFGLTITTYQRQLDDIAIVGRSADQQVRYQNRPHPQNQTAVQPTQPQEAAGDVSGTDGPQTTTADESHHDVDQQAVVRESSEATKPVAVLPISTKSSILAPSDEVYVEDLNGTDQGVPMHLATSSLTCGCPNTCDAVALGRFNKVYTCAKRVQHLMTSYGMNETDACAAASYENEGGPCGLECHPQHCQYRPSDPSALPSYLEPLNWTKAVTLDRPPEPFVRYENVVVATKVLWPNDMLKLKQMICLFTAAYNRHVNYDIVIFTTIPWRRAHIEELRAVAPQTKITVVRDSPPLQDQLATMSPDELKFLHERCNVKEGENLTWFHHCGEPGYRGVANLGYSWQAEFRSFHIWSTPVLKPYKYMIWMDGDSFCTKPWTKDPMKAMVENDLVLMIDNFPQGSAVNPKLTDKMRQAYGNRSVCNLYLSSDGRFSPRECTDNETPKVGLVHGFMHITSLDFYRDPTNQYFLGLLVGDHRFSREWDDQLAVTAPAAMAAPDRVWDLRKNGFHLGIHHNGQVDGKEKNIGNRYTNYWHQKGRAAWDTGREMCDAAVLFAD